VIDEGVFFEGNCKMGTSQSGKSDAETTSSTTASTSNPSWQRKDEKKPEPVVTR